MGGFISACLFYALLTSLNTLCQSFLHQPSCDSLCISILGCRLPAIALAYLSASLCDVLQHFGSCRYLCLCIIHIDSLHPLLSAYSSLSMRSCFSVLILCSCTCSVSFLPCTHILSDVSSHICYKNNSLASYFTLIRCPG